MKLSSIRKNCFRALVCPILAMSILMVFCIPIQAATTYTKEALFSRFPAFLYNDESEKRVNEMVQAGVDILNAQSTSDVTVAYLCTMVDSGISFGLQEIAAHLSNVGGHGDYLSNQNQYRRDLAQNTLARMVNDSDPFIRKSNAAIKKFKIVKNTYKLANQAVGVADVCQYIDFSETNLTLGQATTIGEFVFSKSDGNVITVADNAVDAWKVFVSTMELFEIEIDTIDTLIANVDPSSDLGIGLALLKQDRLSNPFGYMATKYLTDYGIGEMVSTITKLGTSYFENSGSVSFALTALKVFVKYGYVGAQMEDLIQAYMLYSNVNSMSIALANCRLDMINNGCMDGGSKYQTLYVAYLCAVEEFLDKCTDLTTPGEYNLKYIAESNLAALEDGLYISYDIHLKLCTEALNKASADGTLDEGGQPTEVSPAANSSNLADRIAAVQEKYAPNSGIAFSERYGYSVGSFAFVQKVFNLLYNCNMPNTTQAQFRYQLYGSQNVETVGLLKKADMTLANVSELLAKAKQGDVLMGYGTLGAHSMIIVGNDGSSLTMYDCDSPYGPSNSKNAIQQYSFGYSNIKDAFSDSADDRLFPGMALYRAVNRERTYTDGKTVRIGDQAYFTIVNGVLTAYSGYQSKVVIPDGVERISNDVFYDSESRAIIHEVVIPNSVTSIGDGAFQNCKGITSLTIPAIINFNFNTSFSGCTSISHFKLTGTGNMPNYAMNTYQYTPWYISSNAGTEISIEIDEGITSIGSNEFRLCSNLTSLSIPNSISTIYGGAFYKCGKLTGKFVIPDGMTSIGSDTFYGCGKLAGEVVIPNSVTSIGDGAFQNCKGITSLTIPAIINFNFNTSFSGCTSISHFKLTGTGNMPNYAMNTYQYTPWYISSNAGTEISIEIDEGITSIGSNEFCVCGNLTEISIPASVTTIYASSFEGCRNLAKVYFGGSEAQWNQVAVESGDGPLSRAEIVFNSSGSIESGSLGALTWTFHHGTREITITGTVSKAEPVIVAAYDASGKMISVPVITASGGKAIVSFGFDQIKLMWVDSNYAPKCECVVIKAKT